MAKRGTISVKIVRTEMIKSQCSVPLRNDSYIHVSRGSNTSCSNAALEYSSYFVLLKMQWKKWKSVHSIDETSLPHRLESKIWPEKLHIEIARYLIYLCTLN